MIIPTATDVVRTLGAKFEEEILPALTKPQEKRTGHTMRHLLRFLEYRLEEEGQILLDEIYRLTDLLGIVASHFEENTSASPTASKIAKAIRQNLAEKQDPKVYPSLSRMAQRVSVMRQHVCDALAELQKAEGSQAEKVHQLLRDYLAWQIEQEGRMVKPAFWGQGPRR